MISINQVETFRINRVKKIESIFWWHSLDSIARTKIIENYFVDGQYNIDDLLEAYLDSEELIQTLKKSDSSK